MQKILKKFPENFLLSKPKNFVYNMHYLTKYALNTITEEKFLIKKSEKEKFKISKTNIYQKIKFESPKNLTKHFKALKTPKDIITAHSLLNIEYNAIFSYSLIFHNFYLQEKINFSHYEKILKIIYEETTHFILLENYLHKKNYEFGDFPVSNNILNDLKKVDSFLEHICLISLCHESKGIDAGPFLLKKLNNLKFFELKAIVCKILRDEENHVEMGVNLYKEICSLEELEEENFFREFVGRLNLVPIRPNVEIRKKIGFDFYD